MRRLIPGGVLSFSLDVEGKRVLEVSIMKVCMIPIRRNAAAVEAVQTDVQTLFIVDGIETLCTIFAVDGFVCSRNTKVYTRRQQRNSRCSSYQSASR